MYVIEFPSHYAHSWLGLDSYRLDVVTNVTLSVTGSGGSALSNRYRHKTISGRLIAGYILLDILIIHPIARNNSVAIFSYCY